MKYHYTLFSMNSAFWKLSVNYFVIKQQMYTYGREMGEQRQSSLCAIAEWLCGHPSWLYNLSRDDQHLDGSFEYRLWQDFSERGPRCTPQETGTDAIKRNWRKPSLLGKLSLLGTQGILLALADQAFIVDAVGSPGGFICRSAHFLQGVDHHPRTGACLNAPVVH